MMKVRTTRPQSPRRGRLGGSRTRVAARLAAFLPCLGLLGWGLLGLVISGCNGGGSSSSGGSGSPKFLSMGTAPVGGNFPIVGQAVADVVNSHKTDALGKVQTKGTKGSQENIRLLAQGKLQLALSNSAITYYAVRGESGWEKAYDVKAIVTMAPNVAMFIARRDAGIQSIKELEDKRVVVGPAGAGFEMFVRPIMEEHGVDWDKVTKLPATQSAAVNMLADGQADAAFLGGAVPASSITQAIGTFDVQFIPFDEDARQRLIEKYPFFEDVTVPQTAYSNLTAPFKGLNVGSMHLIASADLDEETVYQITKIIWEHRSEIKHPAAKAINEKNAARFTGTEFHPGAARFWKEAGIMSGDKPAAAEPTPPTEPPAETTPAETTPEN